MKRSVVIVGSGGREHALAWKLSLSPHVDRVIVAPGNDGMSATWDRWPLSASAPLLETRIQSYKSFAARAKSEKIDLVIIGPDQPLADGIVDILEAEGVPTLGPSASAARIESSKAFAKEVMQAADVPTAEYYIVDSVEKARDVIHSSSWKSGWVVKADGLALGKGVRVCSQSEEALKAAEDLISLSGTLVIEELLEGEEISWMAFCEGEDCTLLEPARDYKRIGDGNTGPNTGGMGSVSPVPGIACDLKETVRNRVFLPTLKEMKRRGVPFRGILFAGLMVNLKTKKLWVLEFNSRLGDPETQVLLPRMDEDLFPIFEAIAHRRGNQLKPDTRFVKDSAVYVVAASKNYPDTPEVGQAIEIPNEKKDAETLNLPQYFFAGVRKDHGVLKASGGRVLGALGFGANIEMARSFAYQALDKVHFDGMQFRKDIGLFS